MQLSQCRGKFQSTGGAYWYWEFGDGNTSTLQNPSHTYANPGTYYGTLTVKNECGCTDEVPFEIKVTDRISPVIGCISTVCLKDCAFYSVSNICPDASVVWAIHGGQLKSVSRQAGTAIPPQFPSAIEADRL